MRFVRDSRRFIETLEELLRLGYPARFRAEGWSMYPAIRNGDIITVAPLGGSPVQIGDVILYRHGRAAIAHRVVEMRSSSRRTGAPGRSEDSRVEFVLRGDAADGSDAPIPLDRVLGRVVEVQRATIAALMFRGFGASRRR